MYISSISATKGMTQKPRSGTMFFLSFYSLHVNEFILKPGIFENARVLWQHESIWKKEYFIKAICYSMITLWLAKLKLLWVTSGLSVPTALTNIFPPLETVIQRLGKSTNINTCAFIIVAFALSSIANSVTTDQYLFYRQCSFLWMT